MLCIFILISNKIDSKNTLTFSDVNSIVWIWKFTRKSAVWLKLLRILPILICSTDMCFATWDLAEGKLRKDFPGRKLTRFKFDWELYRLIDDLQVISANNGDYQ